MDLTHALPMGDDFEQLSCMLCGSAVKLVAQFSMAYFDVRLHAGGTEFRDAWNAHEPYDRLTHIFYVPRKLLRDGMMLTISALDSAEDGDLCACIVPFAADFADPDALLAAYDSGIRVRETQTEAIAPGAVYRQMQCTDRDGDPVVFTTLEVDPALCTLYIGTPQDGYAAVGVRATIPDMIAAAEQNGQTVYAAVNADFFDIFGDGSPSGLCVKNGSVISEADPSRPFIGVLRDGTAVVADLAERPDLRGDLWQAAAGLPRILKDGALYEWGPLEPFAYVRHPRTAAGVCADGTIILAEVDGRIPAHSNGATLVDLACFLQTLGVVDAVNLDGGGSSAVYTKADGEFRLRTVPADLFRPNDCLIREDYNSLLVVQK